MADRTGILVLSVWLAPGTPERLRARVTSHADVTAPGAHVATVAGTDAILDAVRRWLRDLETDPPTGGERVTRP